MPRFNNTELTPETIQATREWFAANAQACIDEVKSGAVHVNDRTAYFAWREQMAKDSLAGRSDNNLTFLQRAYTIQTGDCVALLP